MKLANITIQTVKTNLVAVVLMGAIMRKARCRGVKPQEAINIIEDVTWQDNGRHDGKIAPAREIAISALGKQIPKKPRTNGDNWFCCRNCGETFSLANTLHKRNKYCGECGTAIDWGDCE